MRSPYDRAHEEVYTIKDDAIGPGVEQGTTARGAASAVGFTKFALGHPVVRYKDRLITCDVYAVGDELMIHLICPRCENALQIKSCNKAINYDQATNELSVERVGCTWELGRGTEATRGDRIAFGVGLCNWTVVVDRNVAKDAR